MSSINIDDTMFVKIKVTVVQPLQQTWVAVDITCPL